MSIPISKLPLRFQEQAIAQIATKAASSQFTKPPPPRLKQNRSGLNKTEEAFLTELSAKMVRDGGDVHSQAITLSLGNGVRYTPDFMTVVYNGNDDGGTIVQFYEVKGYMRDDAAVKIKVAAHAYSHWDFFLVTKERIGWRIERVMP